jgi:ABC-type Fe3+-hydroxamate transport system substrate-binding protein
MKKVLRELEPDLIIAGSGAATQQVEKMLQLIIKLNIRNAKDFPTQIFIKER